MEQQVTSANLAETLEHLWRHWESGRGAVTTPAGRKMASTTTAFTIAVAREAGTQATLIAREIGNRLNWHVYDNELVARIAQDMGLREALLQSVDERRQSQVTEAFEAFLSAPAKNKWEPMVSEIAYVHHLVKSVLTLGMHGQCVIVGRGAAFILPPATTLRVRLVAPQKSRIANLSQTLGISERDAAHKLRVIDRERTDFVKDHFFKDPNDPQFYDLILNVSRFSVPLSAQLIIEALHRLEGSELAA